MKMGSSRVSVGAQSDAAGPSMVSRRRLLQYGGVLGAAVSSPWLFSACEVAEDPGSKKGGEANLDLLRIRVRQDITNLDPAFLYATSVTNGRVAPCIYERLVTYRGNTGEVVPELAEELTASADGLTHEFRLKEGIQFHGGYGELTAEDVKFSFERIAGLTTPAIEASNAPYWSALKEVEVTGKYTGVIRLKEPYAPLMTETLPRDAGMIVSKAAYEDKGAKAFSKHPIGSGSYEFVHWRSGEEVLLRRFDGWSGASEGWTKAPVWKEISFHPITEDTAARIAVETGELDFAQIGLSDVEQMSTDDRFTVTKEELFGYGWVGFNVLDEKLTDVRVRQAIRQAIDVDGVLAAAFDGKLSRANAMIAPGGSPLGYWEDAPAYSVDVEGAKALLAEAGAEGLKLEFTIEEETDGADVVAQVVQANLKEIGIEVSIRKTSGGEIWGELPSLQLFYQAWSCGDDPVSLLQWFTSDQVEKGNNMMGWMNKEYTELNAAALSELDEDSRSEMYVRMQELMDEDAIMAPLHYTGAYFAHKPELVPSLCASDAGVQFRAWDFRVKGE